MLGLVRNVVTTFRCDLHGVTFTVWNAFLAVIPAGLALMLFRRTRQASELHAGWWCAAVVWLLFLPNAPYVLTDVKHMVESLRVSNSSGHAYLVLAAYSMLFVDRTHVVRVVAAAVPPLPSFRRFVHSVASAD